VNDSRNLAPEGWRIPTEDDWNILSDFLGGYSIAGGKMKEAGNLHWISPNMGATNSSKFSAFANGFRDVDGNFNRLRLSAYWWSKTEIDSVHAQAFGLDYDSEAFFYGGLTKSAGAGIRCIKD